MKKILLCLMTFGLSFHLVSWSVISCVPLNKFDINRKLNDYNTSIRNHFFLSSYDILESKPPLPKTNNTLYFNNSVKCSDVHGDTFRPKDTLARSLVRTWNTAIAGLNNNFTTLNVYNLNSKTELNLDQNEIQCVFNAADNQWTGKLSFFYDLSMRMAALTAQLSYSFECNIQFRPLKKEITMSEINNDLIINSQKNPEIIKTRYTVDILKWFDLNLKNEYILNIKKFNNWIQGTDFDNYFLLNNWVKNPLNNNFSRVVYSPNLIFGTVSYSFIHEHSNNSLIGCDIDFALSYLAFNNQICYMFNNSNLPMLIKLTFYFK